MSSGQRMTGRGASTKAASRFPSSTQATSSAALAGPMPFIFASSGMDAVAIPFKEPNVEHRTPPLLVPPQPAVDRYRVGGIAVQNGDHGPDCLNGKFPHDHAQADVIELLVALQAGVLLHQRLGGPGEEHPEPVVIDAEVH